MKAGTTILCLSSIAWDGRKRKSIRLLWRCAGAHWIMKGSFEMSVSKRIKVGAGVSDGLSVKLCAKFKEKRTTHNTRERGQHQLCPRCARQSSFPHLYLILVLLSWLKSEHCSISCVSRQVSEFRVFSLCFFHHFSRKHLTAKKKGSWNGCHFFWIRLL